MGQPLTQLLDKIIDGLEDHLSTNELLDKLGAIKVAGLLRRPQNSSTTQLSNDMTSRKPDFLGIASSRRTAPVWGPTPLWSVPLIKDSPHFPD